MMRARGGACILYILHTRSDTQVMSSYRRSQSCSGYSLVEILLVLVVIAALGAAVGWFFLAQQRSQAAHEAASLIQRIRITAERLAQNENDFSAVDSAAVLAAMPDLAGPGGTWRNPFPELGAVSFTGQATTPMTPTAWTNNSAFLIWLSRVPNASCAPLAIETGLTMPFVMIGTTVVKSVRDNIDVRTDQIAAACAATSNPSMTWRFPG